MNRNTASCQITYSGSSRSSSHLPRKGKYMIEASTQDIEDLGISAPGLEYASPDARKPRRVCSADSQGQEAIYTVPKPPLRSNTLSCSLTGQRKQHRGGQTGQRDGHWALGTGHVALIPFLCLQLRLPVGVSLSLFSVCLFVLFVCLFVCFSLSVCFAL